MAYVIIKSDERKQYETFVGSKFGADVSKAEHREYQECIAARTQEAVKELQRMNSK